MLKIKQQIYEAILYYQNNPLESKTSICKKFNIDRSNFLSQCEKIFPSNGFYKDNYYYCFTEEELEIIEEYKNGVTIPNLIIKYNHNRETIERWLKLSETFIRKDNRKYSLNENKFDTITTEEDAYWLGFILADGYLNEERGFLNIKLQTKDESHLKKFLTYIESSAPIVDDRGGSGQIIKSIVINSRKLCNNLVKQGIFQNKTFYERPNLQIPPNLIKHYIRGLIDGDGCLTNGTNSYQFDFVGNYEIVKFIRDYIDNNVCHLDLEYIYNHGKIMRLTIRKSNYVKECYDYFYSNAKYFLDRKYEIAMQYLHGRGKIEEKNWNGEIPIRGEGL